MALVLQGTFAEGLVEFYFDIVANEVRGAQLINNSGKLIYVDIFRPGGRVQEFTVGDGTHTRNLPGPQRFIYDSEVSADWSYSISIPG